MSNRELPMMPWYPDQFASSTIGWTWVEKAVYRALLDAQWSLGFLKDDQKLCSKICGMELRTFRKAWETVKEKFPKDEQGHLRNFRLDQHRLAALELKATRAESGRLGGLAKASNAKAPQEQLLQHRFSPALAKPYPPSPSPSPSPDGEGNSQNPLTSEVPVSQYPVDRSPEDLKKLIGKAARKIPSERERQEEIARRRQTAAAMCETEQTQKLPKKTRRRSWTEDERQQEIDRRQREAAAVCETEAARVAKKSTDS